MHHRHTGAIEHVLWQVIKTKRWLLDFVFFINLKILIYLFNFMFLNIKFLFCVPAIFSYLWSILNVSMFVGALPVIAFHAGRYGSYKLYYQYTRVGIDDVHTNISPALASSIHQYNRVFDYLYTHIKCIFCVFMCFVLKATLWKIGHAVFIESNVFLFIYITFVYIYICICLLRNILPKKE